MLKLFLFPFRIIFKLLGINYNQLYAILSIKLKMDNRRPLSFSSKKNDSNNQLLMQTIFYTILGGLLVSSVALFKSSLLSYTIFFSFLMVMMALAMITEYTNILFDTRDNAILLSRPINNQTLTLAKIFHIAIYMLEITMSLSLVLLIYTIIKYGAMVTLLLFLLLILTAFFTLFITNIFYFLLSSLVNIRKMKDIVVYFQIIMAIMFMGGYQLMPRIMDFYNIEKIGSMTLKWWYIFIPPTWMSGTLDILIAENYDLIHLILVIAAILIPVLCLIMVVKVLSPRFNKALQQDDKDTKVSKKFKITNNKQGLITVIASFLSSNKQEAVCFKMIWKMSSRERKFKQTVYPVFGYILIFIVMFAFKNNDFSLATLQAGKHYILFLYFPMLLSFSLMTNLCFSEDKKSSWFYRSAPIHSPGIILLGALKSMYIKYVVPTYFVLTAVCVYIWGLYILDDILLAFIINLFGVSLIYKIQVHDLPFTIEKNGSDMSNNFMKGLLIMFAIGFSCGLHYGLSYINYAVLIAIIPFTISLLYVFKSYNKINWNKIYS